MRKTSMALAAALSVMLAVLVTGCGGKSAMTLEQFVRKAYELDAQHETTAGPLREQLDTATTNLSPADKLPDGVVDTLTKLFDEEDRFADKMKGVDAPREAKDIQTEAVAALKADASLGRKIVGGLGKEATLGDLGSAFESDEAAAVQTRRENACQSIQKLADDNHLDVDMSC